MSCADLSREMRRVPRDPKWSHFGLLSRSYEDVLVEWFWRVLANSLQRGNANANFWLSYTKSYVGVCVARFTGCLLKLPFGAVLERFPISGLCPLPVPKHPGHRSWDSDWTSGSKEENEGHRLQGQGFFTWGDARSFSGLTSKIPPLGSMLNFDADVKKRPRVTNVKTASRTSLL